MPKASGLDVLPAIQKRDPAPHVLILSSFDYEEDIYRAAKAGARGYLMKDLLARKLLKRFAPWPVESCTFPRGLRHAFWNGKAAPA